MKGTGIYGAYKNARPLEQDFGSDLLEHEQLGFQHRKEQREIQDRKDKKAKDLKDRIVKAKKALRPAYTGIKNEDQKRGELALKASDILNKAKIELEKNPNNVKASLVVSNLEDFPLRFKQMTERYTNWMSDGIQGLKDGTYSPYLNRDNIDKVEKVIKGNVNYSVDQYGNITGSYDKDGDGAPDFTWDGMATGVDLETYKNRFDPISFKKEVKQQYGTLHTKNPDGTYTYQEIKELSPQSKTAIHQEIEKLFGANAENITDEGLSYIYDELDTNMDIPVNDQMLVEAKNRFLLENIAMWDRKEFNTKDFAAQDRDQNRGLQWAKLRAKKNNKPPRKDQEELNNLRTLTEGLRLGDPESLGILKKATIKRPNDSKKGFKEVAVSNIEYTKDRIVIELENGETHTFNTNDLNDFNGSMVSFIRPDLPPEKAMLIFDKGELTRTLGRTVSTKTKTLKEIREKMNEAVDKAWAINSWGYEMQKHINNQYNNDGIRAKKAGKNKISIIGTDGEMRYFNVGTAQEREKLGKWLHEQFGETKSYPPEQTNNTNENNTATGVGAKYNK